MDMATIIADPATPNSILPPSPLGTQKPEAILGTVDVLGDVSINTLHLMHLTAMTLLEILRETYIPVLDNIEKRNRTRLTTKAASLRF